MTSTLLLFPQRQQRIPTTHASQRIVFFVFCIHDEKQQQQCRSVVVFVFPRSFCTATWCDHGEFNALLLFICYLLFCFPVLSCYNILYLSCSNQLHTGWNVKRSVYFLTSKFFSLYFCVIEMTVQFMTTQEVVVNEAEVQFFDLLLAYTKRLGIFNCTAYGETFPAQVYFTY